MQLRDKIVSDSGLNFQALGLDSVSRSGPWSARECPVQTLGQEYRSPGEQPQDWRSAL